MLAVELDAVDESGPAPQENYSACANYNVAPTTPVLAVVRSEGQRRVRRLRWGFVAPWAQRYGEGPPLLNARAESVTAKPTFREAVRSRRCLIPMDGWYEWEMSRDDAGKPVRTPRYMSARDGGTLLMAGIWSTWHDGEQQGRSSCAIVTTDSVGALRQVHDRMPLIMPAADWPRWLEPGLDESLLAPPSAATAGSVAIRRVSRLVNSVRNNGPELLAPDGPEPEQLTLL